MDHLVTVVEHVSVSRFVGVAGATLWAYDYLLTCVTEYERIWPTQWSLVKVLFLTVRYIAVPYIALSMYFVIPNLPAGYPSLTLMSSCRFYSIAVLVFRILELGSQSCLVVIRVRALYGGRLWVTWALYSAFVLTHATTITLSLSSVLETYSSLGYSLIFHVCVANITKFAKFVYFIEIPLEILLLAMQLVHYWRLSRALAPVQPSHLLKTLYTDGVIYFAGTVTLRLWAGLVVIFLDPTYWYMTVILELALSSAFVSRMVLHLNQVAFQVPKGNTLPSNGISTLQLVEPQPPVDLWMEMKFQPSRQSHDDP
ncbi:hypothetical protein M408DRAFT_317851 [Serendipita vermifera MAFF 305830]|uniref:DUF6533 domain-containing protein n=1 Tax=Serendipita vermifera MAFF 305830 TaxID=933852 RepID=A0A0C3BJH2_SERVB|nr:hypothetical protein M408DRAFT_317851 [Serendipita vermifera MAFF 305830]